MTEEEVLEIREKRIKEVGKVIQSLYVSLKDLKDADDSYKELPRRVRRLKENRDFHKLIMFKADELIEKIRHYEQIRKQFKDDTSRS